MGFNSGLKELICLGHMLEYNRNLLKASENF
jgi:hypothetical protein